MKVREPAVAGRFYPGSTHELRATVDSYLQPKQPRQRAIACVVPHAGFMYSGHVAGAVYSAVELPKRIIIMGPNHTGRGAPLATQMSGAWRTPLGDVAIDEELANELAEAMPLVADDDLAHRFEHSIEVQLPFLQRTVDELAFLPVCVGTSEFDVLVELGHALATVLKRFRADNRSDMGPSSLRSSGPEILIVCSSDMNHYETDEVTRIKDAKAIAPILQVDAAALYETVRRERVSMCGYAPATAMLAACAALGAKQGTLLKYATSTDVSGDSSHCVGYAGIVIA